MNISKNGAGLVLLIATLFGINITEADAISTIEAIMQLFSVGLLVWNQIDRKDTTKFLFKK